MLHVVSTPLSLVSFGVFARDFAVINCLMFFQVVNQEFLENYCFCFLLCIKKPVSFFFPFLARKRKNYQLYFRNIYA